MIEDEDIRTTSTIMTRDEVVNLWRAARDSREVVHGLYESHNRQIPQPFIGEAQGHDPDRLTFCDGGTVIVIPASSILWMKVCKSKIGETRAMTEKNSPE